jgi:hypothetical protein
MSAGDQGTASAPLTQAQVLSELYFLATVEHALVVEALSVSYAFGTDLDADEGGAITDQGRAVADAASSLAQSQMFLMKGVNLALAAAGQFTDLGRAASIADAAGASIPLDPPSLPQLLQLTVREQAIAAAVDARYANLSPAVTTAPVFDGDLLGQLQHVVEAGTTHAAGFSGLLDALSGLEPGGYLCATRRTAAGGFEERLLAASDGCYSLLLASLQEQFGQQSGFSSTAISAMDTLNTVNHALAQRRLLPPFTAP